MPPATWASVPTGGVFRGGFYTINFLFMSPLPPDAFSGMMPPVSSDEEAAVACRSTPSAFLTHVSTYLVPVKRQQWRNEFPGH